MTPDCSYPNRQDFSIRPSWSANPGYLNEGHRGVFGETKGIPGWQAEADRYKLYEMAYFAGDVILELGVYGGVVELKGALSNPARTRKPQLFGLDVDPAAISRTFESLKAFGLEEHVLLYQGAIEAFMSEFPNGERMGDEAFARRREALLRDYGILPRELNEVE